MKIHIDIEDCTSILDSNVKHIVNSVFKQFLRETRYVKLEQKLNIYIRINCSKQCSRHDFFSLNR